MERFSPNARTDRYGSRLHRGHSSVLATVIPWASIMLASVLPLFFITAALPVVPPLAYLLMIAWRIVRPGLFPLWAGLPLGAFDDLFSGQPMGSGILLFSLTMIAFELLETRFPWRSFAQDWVTAALFVIGYILMAAIFSGAVLTPNLLIAIVPQIVLSILAFPILARLAAALDRLRLLRWMAVR